MQTAISTSARVTTPGIDNHGYERVPDTGITNTTGSVAYEEINDNAPQAVGNSNDQSPQNKDGAESDYVIASDDYAVTFTENDVYH